MRKTSQQSSLSSLWTKIEKNETALVTAFRGKVYDENGICTYTDKENQARKESLRARIQGFGFHLTSIKGSYFENYGTSEAIEVGDYIYFVEDATERDDLKEKLIEWGEYFQQDSVLLINKGGLSSVLIGTNHSSEFLGWNKEEHFDHFEYGSEVDFLTTIKSWPFRLENEIQNILGPDGSMGRKACAAAAKKPWESFLTD